MPTTPLPLQSTRSPSRSTSPSPVPSACSSPLPVGLSSLPPPLLQVYREPDDPLSWLGASPDGLLPSDSFHLDRNGGVLEIKCPYGSTGDPSQAKPYGKVPWYYVPQVQGLMEVLDRDWLDFFVWTGEGSEVYRVQRDRAYWNVLLVGEWETRGVLERAASG